MDKSLQKLILVLSLFTIMKPAQAQYLVDYTFLGTYSKSTLSLIFQQNVDYGVNLYKIRYNTVDIHNATDTASGLLVLPIVPASTLLPIVVYEHGTVDSSNDVPSQLRGRYEAAMAYGAFGFATLAPDYLGLGDARGFHPWLHAASEVSASLDMLFAGYEYLDNNDPDYDPAYLFLAGYSQGGHASMALQKEIDEVWSIIIPVTAAAHMSGLYDLSGVMETKLLGDEPFSPAYIAYLFTSYNEAYNLYNDIGDIFKEPYATTIRTFHNDSISLSQLEVQLVTELNTAGETVAKAILQDSILDGLLNNPNHPLNIAQRENDTYNFAPASPTRLYYCLADESVPYQNSIVAESVMNGLGAADVQAINVDSTLTHVACAYSAIPLSIAFFKSFLAPSSIHDLKKGAEELIIYPNPTFDDVSMDWSAGENGYDYEIFNTSGIIVGMGTTSSNRLSLSNLPGGLYMIICTAGKETRMGRVLRQ